MAGIPAKFGSSDFQKDSLSSAKRRLIIRTMGATLIIALVALVASQQATSSPENDTKRSHGQIQLDVVKDSSKGTSSSEKSGPNSDALNTTDTATGSASNTSSSSVKVTVNGQPVDVPENGTTQQTITTPSGSTSVNISNNSSGSDTSFSSSFSSANQNDVSSSVDSSFTSTQSSGGP